MGLLDKASQSRQPQGGGLLALSQKKKALASDAPAASKGGDAPKVGASLPTLSLDEYLSEVRSPILYPYALAQCSVRELGDDLAALYELIGGEFRLVTALSPSGPAEAPAILPKELLLSPFKDGGEAEPRRFLGEISSSSVRLTALAMPELILAGSPGRASARNGDGRAAAAAAFRRERLAEERPVELIGRSLFAELRAEHASMAAPYAAVYALDLDPVVAEWSAACPLVDEAALYRDALRFMAKALADTGCVRSAPGYGVVAAQFCPRMPDAELLASQMASTMRRILALEDGPAPLSHIAVDLRERESAEAIKAFLPDGF